jgi:hypothetical protein
LKKTNAPRRFNYNNSVFNYRANNENYNGVNAFNLPLGSNMTQENANAIFAANRDPSARQVEKDIDLLTRPVARRATLRRRRARS